MCTVCKRKTEASVCSKCKKLHYTTCDKCNGKFHNAFILNYNGFKICDICFNRTYVVCQNCGLLFDKTSADEHCLCSNCYPLLRACADCGKKFIHFETLMVEGEEKEICYSCRPKYSMCNNCGEYYIRNSKGYCDSCLRELKLCKRCGIILNGANSNPYYSIDDETHICYVCLETYYDAKCLAWNYKPNAFCIHKKPSSRFIFGIEIETEAAERKAVSIYHIKKQFSSQELYIKHDGSLDRDRGFEIVTQPHSESCLREKNLLQRIHSMEGSYIFTETAIGAGLHIHVCKEVFSSDAMENIAIFFYNNQEFIEKIAGRRMNRYCQIDKSEDNAIERIADGGGSKYFAFNTMPPKTNEFRIFAPTSNPEKIFTYFQFIRSLVSFVSQSDSILKADYVKFLDKENKYNLITNKVKSICV